MGNSLPTENLRIGSITAGALQIDPYSPDHKEALHALEKTYRGVLAINLTHYKAARKDPPLFESIDTLTGLASKEVILCLLPSTDDVVEHLYKSYTSEGKSVNIYKCNYALYALVDKALLPAALTDEK
jgi:hypothetical protein